MEIVLVCLFSRSQNKSSGILSEGTYRWLFCTEINNVLAFLKRICTCDCLNHWHTLITQPRNKHDKEKYSIRASGQNLPNQTGMFHSYWTLVSPIQCIFKADKVILGWADSPANHKRLQSMSLPHNDHRPHHPYKQHTSSLTNHQSDTLLEQFRVHKNAH